MSARSSLRLSLVGISAGQLLGFVRSRVSHSQGSELLGRIREELGRIERALEAEVSGSG
jgi:hypothetical protein